MWHQPCVASEAGFPIGNTFSSVDVSASAPVWKTVQDDKGNLYFGSQAIETFDGDHWRRWTVAHGRTFRALEFGVDGRLWAGGTGELGWFSRGEGSERTFVSLNDHLPPGAQSRAISVKSAIRSSVAVRKYAARRSQLPCVHAVVL